jgi:hypothetical protein
LDIVHFSFSLSRCWQNIKHIYTFNYACCWLQSTVPPAVPPGIQPFQVVDADGNCAILGGILGNCRNLAASALIGRLAVWRSGCFSSDFGKARTMNAKNAPQGDETEQPVPSTTQPPPAPAPPAVEAPVNLRKVPLDTWNKLRFIAYYLLGSLMLMFGLTLGLANLSDRKEDFESTMLVSVVLVVWGAFVLYCAKARYLGGVRTFFGAALAAIGLGFLLAGVSGCPPSRADGRHQPCGRAFLSVYRWSTIVPGP